MMMMMILHILASACYHLFQNLQASYSFSENERLKYVERMFYLIFCGCETLLSHKRNRLRLFKSRGVEEDTWT